MLTICVICDRPMCSVLVNIHGNVTRIDEYNIIQTEMNYVEPSFPFSVTLDCRFDASN